MPNLPISQLPQSTTLQGDELLVNVQGGVTKKQTVQDILNANLPVTSSGITVSGDIVPTTPQGATLGTIDKPFRDIFLQSGSISIESDTPGDPSALISNNNGNLDISVGGMRLVEPGNSFIAETGSFQYISGSLTQVGSYIRVGDTITTGSVSFTGSFEASLTKDYIWIGDSNNRSTEVSASALATYLTSSFVTPAQTGSFIQSAYFSGYSSSSIALSTSGSEQVIPLTSIWTQNGISLVDNTKFTFAKAGVYKFELLTTVLNDQTSEYDAWFWVKLNGTNFPNSTVKVTIQKQKGSGEHAHELVAISILGVAQNDGDYIQIFWTGENTNLEMVTENGNGVYPSSPSVITNIIRVG
jgi:hypothetical protein